MSLKLIVTSIGLFNITTLSNTACLYGSVFRTDLQLRWKSQALPDILQYTIYCYTYTYIQIHGTHSEYKKNRKKNIFNVEIFSFIQYSYMKYKNYIILSILINLIKILLRFKQSHKNIIMLIHSHEIYQYSKYLSI